MPFSHQTAAANSGGGGPAVAVAYADGILRAFRPQLGGDFGAYRNHVARVIHFCLALGRTPLPDHESKIAIGAAFHDLGIWTHRTLDYLGPSIELAGDYLRQSGHSGWIDEMTMIIEMHHKLTALKTDGMALAERFRRADWIDVSLGLRRFGLTARYIREVKRALPNSGFHRLLTRLAWQRFKTHPGDPLPMLRW